VSDLIRACADVGTEQFKAELLATAIAQQLATTLAQQLRVGQAAGKCFSCGQEGHLKWQCPKRTSGPGAARTPPRPCPRCQKGFHWSNQCRSKFDKNGNRLPKLGNSERGARSGAPQ
ncbi:GAK10 protein, partial [Malurus elegans]|nr:GAK10 protein [Malurus elegans]